MAEEGWEVGQESGVALGQSQGRDGQGRAGPGQSQGPGPGPADGLVPARMGPRPVPGWRRLAVLCDRLSLAL